MFNAQSKFIYLFNSHLMCRGNKPLTQRHLYFTISHSRFKNGHRHRTQSAPPIRNGRSVCRSIGDWKRSKCYTTAHQRQRNVTAGFEERSSVGREARLVKPESLQFGAESKRHFRCSTLYGKIYRGLRWYCRDVAEGGEGLA